MHGLDGGRGGVPPALPATTNSVTLCGGSVTTMLLPLSETSGSRTILAPEDPRMADMKNDGPKVRFFRSAEHLRAWFEKHHDTATELWIGYYKKSSGKPTVTYSESLDEALCFGWIDGIRKRIDEVSFTNRFSPRRAISKWSLVNIRRVKALTAEGRMRPAGLKAFETRRANTSGIYSYENRPEQLDEPYQGLLRKHPAAWEFFQSRPPYHRRSVCWWILSAKQEATRLRRLQHLIDTATRGRTIDPMAPAASRKSRAD